jgi:putative Mg2+ transporter-C (MgtC) family protein
MPHEYLDLSLRLGVALLAGAIIGLERSYSGRAAGFRTHALVCVSCALLMFITAFESFWVSPLSGGRLVLDPTRMAQGIMTGIGFLGAGAIIKAGYSIHGLTTAASIWTTAAIGILIGVGFYFPAILATAVTLGVLTAFRWIEARAPAIYYVHCVLRFARESAMPESEVRALLSRHGFGVASLNYRLSSADDFFEYRMVIRSTRSKNARALSETMATMPAIKEFRLSPTGE